MLRLDSTSAGDHGPVPGRRADESPRCTRPTVDGFAADSIPRVVSTCGRFQVFVKVRERREPGAREWSGGIR